MSGAIRLWRWSARPEKAGALKALGCEIVAGDLLNSVAMRAAMDGCDGVFHIAGVYKVGIPESEREPMLRSNIDGTATVLDAAFAVAVPPNRLCLDLQRVR